MFDWDIAEEGGTNLGTTRKGILRWSGSLMSTAPPLSEPLHVVAIPVDDEVTNPPQATEVSPSNGKPKVCRDFGFEFNDVKGDPVLVYFFHPYNSAKEWRRDGRRARCRGKKEG